MEYDVQLSLAKTNVSLKSIKRMLWSGAHGHYMSPELIACWQRPICLVFTIGVSNYTDVYPQKAANASKHIKVVGQCQSNSYMFSGLSC